jgi:hypothetical protein
VANSGDGTVARLDGAGGRVLDRALPAGPAPWRIAPSPAGGLLVLSLDADHVGTLSQLIPPAGGQGGWTVRQVPVGARTRLALLAGDGGTYAAVAYSAGTAEATPASAAVSTPGPPPCGLDLVDAQAGRVVRRHAVCVPGDEVVTGLALEGGPGGPLAYLAIAGRSDWPDAAPATPAPGVGGLRGRSRLVALAAESGATLAALPLEGTPAAVLLAPAPGRAGRRLYLVETGAGPDPDSPPPDRARLLGLDPTTLGVECEYRLDFRPLELAIGPEGDHGYALAGDGHRLLHLDLRTGAEAPLADLPLGATGIAVTATAVYVAQPAGDSVGVVPRGRAAGARATTIPVGRHPTGLARHGAE